MSTSYNEILLGNAACPPTLLATANFTGFGLIDGVQYGANGLGIGATTVFFRQVRNFIFDMTLIPGSQAATGIHWQVDEPTCMDEVIDAD